MENKKLLNIILYRWRELVLLALIIVNVYIFSNLLANEKHLLKVAFLDVGQGDSAIIITPSGNTFVIDGGANKMSLRQMSKIVPFYKTTLDGIFITHTDKDHSGGVFDILQNFMVKDIFNSGLFTKEEERLGLQDLFDKTDEIPLGEGDFVKLDENIFLEILWPPKIISDDTAKDPNDFSLVMRLVYGESSVLFMGDAPQSVEKFLISKYGAKLDSNILKVGHHGSKTSSSEVFIFAVSPEFSIVSAGKDNSFGHPHKEVIEILQKASSTILETFNLGNISFCLDGQASSLCEL